MNFLRFHTITKKSMDFRDRYIKPTIYSFSGRKFRPFSSKIFYQLQYAQKFPSPKNRPEIFLYPAIFWTLKILEHFKIFYIFWVYFDIFFAGYSFSGRKFQAFCPKIFFWPKYAQKFTLAKNRPKIFISGHIWDRKQNLTISRFFTFFGYIFIFFFCWLLIFWPEISSFLSANFLTAKICPKISIAQKLAKNFYIRPYLGP